VCAGVALSCVCALVWSYLSSLIISFVAFSFCLSCCLCFVFVVGVAVACLTGWQQQQKYARQQQQTEKITTTTTTTRATKMW